MPFHKTIGLQDTPSETAKVFRREALRAVIFHNNSLLLILTNKGDYKFPGGGADKNETHTDTLTREVREETGYSLASVQDKLGITVERKPDDFAPGAIFEMVSHYYFCTISDKYTTQTLDDYEAALEFQPAWVSIPDAIRTNEEVLKKDAALQNPWVYRETQVLHTLLQDLKPLITPPVTK